MKYLTWPDNVCTVGATCIHGAFSPKDLTLLFNLCPSGTFTPTFFNSSLPVQSYGKADKAKLVKVCRTPRYTGDNDTYRMFYFTFNEEKGARLLAYLTKEFSLQRGPMAEG